MDSYIICGSRRYEHANFNKLVDSFDVIVRHNMLLPDNNYGKRDATRQILNGHIYENYTKNLPPLKWRPNYHKEFGIPEDHIDAFYEYLKKDNVIFQNFAGNNTELMKSILRKHGINHKITKCVRCGFAYMADCMHKGIKPFLIGLSLQKRDQLNKQYTRKDGTGYHHDVASEIDLIKKLHSADLVDATFCAIKDTTSMEIDSSLLTPTITSLNIIKRFIE